MAGGIILSRRLERVHQAARDLGDTFEGIRTQQRKTQLEDEDRRIASEDRASANKARATQQQVADLQLGEFQRRDAARREAEGLAGELANFGQAVPQNEITAPADGMLPGFQGMRSERPAVDMAGESLKDRIRASWMNAEARSKGETAAFTAADVKRQREEAAAAKTRAEEDRALKIRGDTADAAGKELGNKKTKLEIDKLEAQTNAAGGPSQAITEDNKGVWDKLFSGYRSDSQTTKDSLGQIRKLEALVNSKATGASDIATLYTFIRSFDSPNSAVREAEAQMGQEAAGALNKLLNLRAKYEKGRILPDTVRSEMLQAVQTIKADHEKFLGAVNSRYSRLAQAGGLDPSLVVDPEFMAAQTSGPAGSPPPAATGSGQRPAQAAGGQDSEAVAWAKANPNDPRSARILQLNGAR
jgi:hypothetical protein